MRTLIFTSGPSSEVRHHTNARHGRIPAPSGDVVGGLGRSGRLSPARGGYWAGRLVRNVGILGVALVVHLVVIAQTSDSPQVMYRLIMATGYVSAVLIAWTLLIGRSVERCIVMSSAVRDTVCAT